MSNKYTTEKFIQKAISIHGSKYNYSKVNYIGSKEKVTIICPIHGEFNQIAKTHLEGRGCPSCGQIKSNESKRGNKSIEKLNQELKEFGWELYGEYNGSHNSAEFRCLKCGNIQKVAQAKSIRTAKCRNCEKHICLKCRKEFLLPNGAGRKSTRRFCYECLPYDTTEREGKNMYHKLWVEYVINQIKQRYGTSCTICGYNKNYAALDFHHVNPEEKEFSPAKLIYASYDLEEIFKELDKCQLICANCHREIHNPEQNNN